MEVTPFTRQLGYQPGVQLNQVIDQTGDGFASENTDQLAATAGRFLRGRIDKSFKVNRSNVYRLLGKPASPQINQLNETFIHVVEALNNGAYEVVLSRLVPTGAVNSLMVCKADPVPANVWVAATSPAAGYAFTVKHLECFGDGVKIGVHAPANGTSDPSTEIKLRLWDVQTGELLFDFAGSLDPAAVDEYNQSRYLPNVISGQTDLVEFTAGIGATIPSTATFYGLDAQGAEKWESKVLTYFSEGGTTYTNTDYDAALARLRYGMHNFGYLMGGGTKAVALIGKMVALGKEINKQFVWDIPGDLTPDAAITFYNQFNIDTHYSQAYWAPLKMDDPVNGGKQYIGRSCVQVGMRCGRNANTDANGLAAKQFAVAGKEWPLTNTGINQTYSPTEQELSSLAKAKINPVLFTRYNSGGRFVFTDSLTGAKTEGNRKLIVVADMASANDDYVTSFGQECLQLPMAIGVRRMSDFLQKLFEAEQARGWLVPSAELGGAGFRFEVKPNAARPKDRMDVKYWCSYEGTVRAIYVQQIISK